MQRLVVLLRLNFVQQSKQKQTSWDPKTIFYVSQSCGREMTAVQIWHLPLNFSENTALYCSRRLIPQYLALFSCQVP